MSSICRYRAMAGNLRLVTGLESGGILQQDGQPANARQHHRSRWYPTTVNCRGRQGSIDDLDLGLGIWRSAYAAKHCRCGHCRVRYVHTTSHPLTRHQNSEMTAIIPRLIYRYRPILVPQIPEINVRPRRLSLSLSFSNPPDTRRRLRPRPLARQPTPPLHRHVNCYPAHLPARFPAFPGAQGARECARPGGSAEGRV